MAAEQAAGSAADTPADSRAPEQMTDEKDGGMGGKDAPAPVESSLLVTPAAIGFLLGLCLLALYHKAGAIAYLFGFAFILCSCAAVWGRLSLRNVDYRIALPVRGFFPGETFSLNRTLSNDKRLPLIWLEVFEPYEDSRCIEPGEDCLVNLPTGLCGYYYSFSFIKWRQRLSFSDSWFAVKRGIHRIGAVGLRSGDGFGLSGVSKELLQPEDSFITVYPALADVSPERILQDIWDASSASRGYLEDDSLIKSVRDYRISDPGRRINQRLLARGQGLKVNQYEIVAPAGVLFILDTPSFAGLDRASLEDALSILASMIVALSGRGIAVGLAAPATKYFPQTFVQPTVGEVELHSMLKALAAADREDPSFDLKSASDALEGATADAGPGHVYYIAGAMGAIRSLSVLASFPEHKVKILLYEDEASMAETGGIHVRSLQRLRRAS